MSLQEKTVKIDVEVTPGQLRALEYARTVMIYDGARYAGGVAGQDAVVRMHLRMVEETLGWLEEVIEMVRTERMRAALAADKEH